MIEVKNFTKKYGNFVAVDNISFVVNDGEIVGLLGPNGAGKSTTMNAITGYIEQTDGEITVNGYDTIKKIKKIKKRNWLYARRNTIIYGFNNKGICYIYGRT